MENESRTKKNFAKTLKLSSPPMLVEISEIEEAVTFYRIYAVACGFDVRKYTTKRWRGGEIKSKLLVCNREGFKHKGQLECSGGQDSGFFFDYDVDSDGSLSKAIWADGIARRNYSVFGDVVSFDPTYSTNKYDMSFTPFTGVDNHKRSVTFCGALVAHEDETRLNGFSPVFWLRWVAKSLTIEVHGAQVYSHKVFEEFQEEAKCSIGTCKSRGFTECGSLELTIVRDANKDINYEVTYYPDTLKATCSCRMLEGKGILCRHVIWIYSSNGVKIIPEQCVVKRWCKDARLSKMFDCNGEATEDVDIIDGKQIAMSVMWSEIHQTVGMLMGKMKNDVDNFSSLIRQFKDKLSPLGSPLNKQQQLEKILGCYLI
ncbi:uncharacterized protein LOC141640832 [Silene latifolia]|uniref:uncharacterized protein LOC141640832 n=1 Tax=Silene latifolia TaxID=37657 RepID=UPI003D77DB15